MFQKAKENLLAWIIKGVLNEKPLRMKMARAFISGWFRRHEMGETKKIWKSKTFWINALACIAALLTAIMATEGLDPKIVGMIGGILSFVNIGLRLITSKPIQ